MPTPPFHLISKNKAERRREKAFIFISPTGKRRQKNIEEVVVLLVHRPFQTSKARKAPGYSDDDDDDHHQYDEAPLTRSLWKKKKKRTRSFRLQIEDVNKRNEWVDRQLLFLLEIDLIKESKKETGWHHRHEPFNRLHLSRENEDMTINDIVH